MKNNDSLKPTYETATGPIGFTLNSNEIINIELQLYIDKYWKDRSILYLCRAFDSLKESDDYSMLKPTIHFCITDIDLFKDNQRFYSRYYLMEEKTHQIYSKNFSIGVLQLQYRNKATRKDKSNNLVFWANLISAETWEEFKALAEDDPAIKEVGNLMLQMNADDATREALEAQRKYREQYASQYKAGYTDCEEKLTPIIEELADKLAQYKEKYGDL